VAQLYDPGTGFPILRLLLPQGYGGGIRNGLHTDYSSLQHGLFSGALINYALCKRSEQGSRVHEDKCAL
jgi:hypothetical protein